MASCGETKKKQILSDFKKKSNLVNTTIITPSRFSPMIPQLISELASDLSDGIGISSVYIKKDLKTETAITLLKTIKSYIKEL